MEQPPSIKQIKNWLLARNPLSVFRKQKFFIKDIDPKPWSGHFNYLITLGKRQLVLRFRGPEWGSPTGITHEYEILQAIRKYRVGPRVYYLTEDFFGEPMMFQEYLRGKPLPKYSISLQTRLFPAVARVIAKINTISFPEKIFSIHERGMNYLDRKDVWHVRLKAILSHRKTKELGHKIKELMPVAEEMLYTFDEALSRALKKHTPAFVFESAHVGHCMRLHRGGFRFVNWEKVSIGDPSFTLAVFLCSLIGRPDFQEVKEGMIREYMRYNPVPEFRTLVENRIKEREISNMLWVPWAYGEQNRAGIIGKPPDVNERYMRVAHIIEEFRNIHSIYLK